MNPMYLLQLKPAWEQFKKNHPKLVNFVKAASKDGFMDEGSLIEISITNSQGKTISSNVRIKQMDLDFLNTLKSAMEENG